MGDRPDPGDRSLPEQVALLGLATLAADGRTPAHSYEVKETCVEHLEDDAVELNELSDREATRSLNRLAADGVVEEVPPERESAVGKGRPQYDLATDPQELFEELADDDRTKGMVDRIRDGR
jgi:hypothetical protein